MHNSPEMIIFFAVLVALITAVVLLIRWGIKAQGALKKVVDIVSVCIILGSIIFFSVCYLIDIRNRTHSESFQFGKALNIEVEWFEIDSFLDAPNDVKVTVFEAYSECEQIKQFHMDGIVLDFYINENDRKKLEICRQEGRNLASVELCTSIIDSIPHHIFNGSSKIVRE